MALIVEQYAGHLAVLLGGQELACQHVEHDKESKEVRLVFAHCSEADHFAAALQAAARMGMAILLPPLRLDAARHA